MPQPSPSPAPEVPSATLIIPSQAHLCLLPPLSFISLGLPPSSQFVLSRTINLLEEISPDFWSWWFLELVVPFKENSCGEKPALSPAILGSTWNNVEGKGHVSMLI